MRWRDREEEEEKEKRKRTKKRRNERVRSNLNSKFCLVPESTWQPKLFADTWSSIDELVLSMPN